MSAYRAWYRNPSSRVRYAQWDVDIEAADDDDALAQALAQERGYATLVALCAVRVIPLPNENDASGLADRER